MARISIFCYFLTIMFLCVRRLLSSDYRHLRDYLRALNAASLDHDIKPLSALVADLVRREPPPRRHTADEEPAYRAEVAAARHRGMS